MTSRRFVIEKDDEHLTECACPPQLCKHGDDGYRFETVWCVVDTATDAQSDWFWTAREARAYRDKCEQSGALV